MEFCEGKTKVQANWTTNSGGRTSSDVKTIDISEQLNASSVLTFAYNTTYGINAILPMPSASSTSLDNPTWTIKSPIFNARCSNTYFTTQNAGLIDRDKTILKYTGNLYRILKPTSALTQVFMKAANLYNNLL